MFIWEYHNLDCWRRLEGVMVSVSASTSFLSCPSTRSTVGDPRCCFHLSFEYFNFVTNTTANTITNTKAIKKRSNLVPGPPTFDWFFICSSYLTIKFLFMVTVTLQIQMQYKHEHTSKVQAQEVLFPFILRIFQCDGQLSVTSATISPESSVMCIAKCSQRLKEKLSEISGKKNKQWQFPKQIHKMKDLCFKR